MGHATPGDRGPVRAVQRAAHEYGYPLSPNFSKKIEFRAWASVRSFSYGITSMYASGWRVYPNNPRPSGVGSNRPRSRFRNRVGCPVPSPHARAREASCADFGVGVWALTQNRSSLEDRTTTRRRHRASGRRRVMKKAIRRPGRAGTRGLGMSQRDDANIPSRRGSAAPSHRPCFRTRTASPLCSGTTRTLCPSARNCGPSWAIALPCSSSTMPTDSG